jgi:hypothetical protein
MADPASTLFDWTPEMWTEFLQSLGVLCGGQVVQVRVTPFAGPFGKPHQLFQVQARYANSLTQLPQRFFLKFGRSAKEPFFYNNIAPAMPQSPLPRCYAAAYDAAQDLACLLLEDLSYSHAQPEWPLPPDDGNCTALVRTLARIHAHWWQDPRLEVAFRPAIPPGRAWADRRAAAIGRLPEFVNFLGSRLPSHHAAVYRQIARAGASLYEVPPGAPNQTLLHGDAHTWNGMYPQEPAAELRLLDWNMWDIGCPADDLAYLMAVHWSPERRGRLESHLLATYHTTLVDCGVRGYCFTDLEQEYRAAVVRSLLTPVWQWVRGIAPGIWWPHLERIFLAFDDLDCRMLLG